MSEQTPTTPMTNFLTRPDCSKNFEISSKRSGLLKLFNLRLSSNDDMDVLLEASRNDEKSCEGNDRMSLNFRFVSDDELLPAMYPDTKVDPIKVILRKVWENMIFFFFC